MEKYKKHLKWAVPLVVVVLIVGLFLGGLSSAKNTGADWESRLNAQYLSSQNQLDATVKTIKEQFGVAQVKSDKLDQVLQDAVKGRYDGDTSAAPGGNGALFSAMVEAYPDLAGLDTFDKVQDSIASGREAFRQQQDKLLDMLRGYDRWRNRGLIHPMIVSMAGFPSSHLEAHIGTKIIHGAKAREQMFLIVTSESVRNQFETGNGDQINFGK